MEPQNSPEVPKGLPLWEQVTISANPDNDAEIGGNSSDQDARNYYL